MLTLFHFIVRYRCLLARIPCRRNIPFRIVKGMNASVAKARIERLTQTYPSSSLGTVFECQDVLSRLDCINT
jgi:hypothetical protein